MNMLQFQHDQMIISRTRKLNFGILCPSIEYFIGKLLRIKSFIVYDCIFFPNYSVESAEKC